MRDRFGLRTLFRGDARIGALGVDALLLGDRDDPATAEFGEAADDRRIVAEVPVAMEFVELIEFGQVCRSERSLGMPRHVDALPWREMSEDLALDLRVLLLEHLDLGGEVHRLIGSVRFEIGDAAFEFEEAAFAFDDRVHELAPAVGRPLVAGGATVRRAPTP